jgi:hypothetical protein
MILFQELETDCAANVMAVSLLVYSSFSHFSVPCFSVLIAKLSLVQIVADLSDLICVERLLLFLRSIFNCKTTLKLCEVYNSSVLSWQYVLKITNLEILRNFEGISLFNIIIIWTNGTYIQKWISIVFVDPVEN